jgi:WD40 repeat protein
MSSTQSGTITLWDLGSARPLLTGGLGSRVEIAVSREGDRIVKADGDDVARTVRLEMSGVERTWAATPGSARDNVLSAAVSTIDYSPDGKWLATAIWGEVQLRGPDGSLLASERLGTLSNYCSVRFSRDGRSLLAGTAEEGLVRLPLSVREGADPTLGAPQVIEREGSEYITDVSADGAMALVTSFTSGFVKVVTLDGSHAPVRWALPGAAGASFLNGDRQVLANSLESQGGAKMEVRDAADGRVERSLPYPYGAHVNVSADGSIIILGTGSDGTVLLHGRDFSRGTALPAAIRGREFQCAISPNGRIAAFGTGVQAWLVDTVDGSVLAHLQAAQGGSYMPGLAFSPDGSRLALWWETGQLTVWNLEQLRKELRSRGLDW